MDATVVVMNVTRISLKRIFMVLLILRVTIACHKDDATGAYSACGTYKSGQSLGVERDGGFYLLTPKGIKRM